MDEDACGRQVPEVAGVDLVERGEMRGIGDDRLRFARTCYDHLAGYLGVAIADALVAKGHAILTDDGGEVAASGINFLSAFGTVLAPKSGSRRIFCRPCLDWSERRYHIAGHVVRRCTGVAWSVAG